MKYGLQVRTENLTCSVEHVVKNVVRMVQNFSLVEMYL